MRGTPGLTDPAAQAPYLTEWRGRWTGATPLVLRPGSTDEVAAIVRLACETGTKLVPQGGNTGLVGGQIPDPGGTEILVSLTRLRGLARHDGADGAVIAGAGVTLREVQDFAARQDRLFPLSLAAEGTATIGGALSANAGGTGVIAYGTARALCLGLEAVLPDGSVISTLSGLAKDNTGYDLKNLLIGAEGTLGIITAATLKLFPRPRAVATAWAGLASVDAALALLARAGAQARVTGFEFASRAVLDMVLAHVPGTRDPLSARHDWLVLVEIASDRPENLGLALETVLADAAGAGEIEDAVLAKSEAERAQLWRLREAMSEAQKGEGASLKHDVAVPVGLVPAFLRHATMAALGVAPGSRPVPFGHLGDGNVHFNITQPKGGDASAFLALRDAMEDAIHGEALKLGGTVSAEHGIGVAKKDWLVRQKGEGAIAAMRAIKAALDPKGIMNPGKVL